LYFYFESEKVFTRTLNNKTCDDGHDVLNVDTLTVTSCEYREVFYSAVVTAVCVWLELLPVTVTVKSFVSINDLHL